MSPDSWLRFVHILSAMVWLGGGAMLGLLGFRAWRSGEPVAVSQFARTLGFVGLRLLMPAVVVLPSSGVWLVLLGTGWTFAAFWVRLGLALFTVAFLVGAVYLSRVAFRLERAAASTEPSDATPLLQRWLAGYGLVLALLVFGAWDMVFKPGA